MKYFASGHHGRSNTFLSAPPALGMNISREQYDAIVIGVGGMGSAAVFRLAERGLDVLGIERFDIQHARGSSHGSTRIVRLTQPEDHSYVPLARATFENWRDLEAATGRDLLTIPARFTPAQPTRTCSLTPVARLRPTMSITRYLLGRR